MFGADKKALFAKYCLDIWRHLLKQIFPKGQKSIFFSTHLSELFFFLFLLQIIQFLGSYWWILYWLSSE